MRMYLRGRPVVLYGPSDQDTLDPAKVAPPPQNKLKLEWVYGYRWGSYLNIALSVHISPLLNIGLSLLPPYLIIRLFFVSANIFVLSYVATRCQ